MKRHILGTALIFIILVAEDFAMGLFGGYATSGSSFPEYLSSLTVEHVMVILIASFIVYIILRRFFRI